MYKSLLPVSKITALVILNIFFLNYKFLYRALHGQLDTPAFNMVQVNQRNT